MFESLSEKFENVFRKLRGQKTLTEENIKEALREVRMALLEADVNYIVVKDFVARIRERAIGEKVTEGVNPAQQLIYIVNKELVHMMQGGEEPEDTGFEITPGKDSMIMLLGLQGAGKTTFAGKLAFYLKQQKKCRPMLVACDVYRPAAVEQLKQVGGTLGFPVFEMGTDTPVVEIVRNARKKAKESGCDVLIVDTAGRLHIDEVKMEELEGLRDTFKPDYTFLVADAMTGQDAVNSAKAFNEQIGIDGVCLTKMDGDARGGAALSVKAVTGKPIVFAGIGEKASELERFHPDRVAQRILGMGDVVSLVEKAQEAFDEKEAQNLQDKMGKGEFNYNDFLKQMGMVGKMGSLKGLMGMLPGMGSLVRQMDDDVLGKEFGRVQAMILSMTKEERETPDLIKNDGHRRHRVAKGSGHTLKQVNELVRQFEQMRGVMQQMAGGSGMFSGLKGMMGKKGKDMPKPEDILAGGGMPDMSAFGDGQQPLTPGSKEYKQYKKQLKQIKQLDRPQRPPTPPKRQRRKKRR